MGDTFDILFVGASDVAARRVREELESFTEVRFALAEDLVSAVAQIGRAMPDLLLVDRRFEESLQQLLLLIPRVPVLSIGDRRIADRRNGRLVPTFVLPRLGGLAETAHALIGLKKRLRQSSDEGDASPFFSEFVDSLPQIVVEVDRHRRLTYANAWTYEFFGYTKEELKAGIDIAEFVIPSERPRLFEKLAGLLSGQPTVGSEYTLVRRNKPPARVLIHAVPVTRNGELSGFRAILIDITERVNSEDALRKQEKKYRTLFENVNEAILIIDPQSAVVLEANPRAEALHGFPPGALRGVRLDVLTHDEGGRKLELRDLVRSGGTSQKEVVHFRNDGTVLQLVVSSSVMEYEGKPAVLTINRDVTEARRSAEMLRGVINSSPLATIVIDRNSNVVLWSPAAERMFGWTPAETMGKPIPVIPPEHADEFAALQQRLSTGGVTKGFETVRWRKGGSRFDARVSNAALFNHDGSLFGYSAVIEDISVEKKAQRRLRESEERFSKAFHTSPDAININRLSDGRFIEVNDGFTRLSGYTRDEALGKSSGELSIWADPEDRQRFADGLVIRDRIENFEARFRTKSGATTVCLMSAAIVEVDGVPCILSVTRDISARKQMEEELRRHEEQLEDIVRARTESLRRSEETFRALAEDSDDVIMRFDRQLRHLYVNPIVENQTGIPPQDFIGRTHAELGFPPHLVKTWEDALETVFRQRKSHRLEFELPNHIWIDWLLIPEFQPNGEVITVLATSRDITERKRAEEELLSYRDRLEDLVVSRTHELEEVNSRLRNEIAARTGIENELRGSEEKFRFMAETTGDVLYRLNFASLQYDYLSPAFERLTGYDVKGIQERGFGSIVEQIQVLSNDGDSPERIRELRKDGIAGEYRADLLIRMKGGQVRWLHDHSFPWYDADGRLLGSVGILHDISDRKRFENRLAKVNDCFLEFGDDSELNINRLTALCGELLEGATALYNRLDDDLLRSVGIWNAPGDYLRVDRKEGHICTDVIREGKEDVRIVRNLSETPYRESDPNVGRYGLQTYVGKAVKFSGTAIGSLCVVFTKDFAPTEEDKKLLGIIAAAIGVEEERRKAEEQLRLQRAALESAANAIVITDPLGNVTWSNPAIENLTGYAPEEIRGKSTKLLKSGAQGSEFYTSLWKTISSGRVWHGELVNKRKDGTLYSEEMTITPVLDASGTITQYIAVKQDVTDRKDLQRQLLQSQKMQSLGTLAGGVAHDFNNILGIILGYASLLDRATADPSKRRAAAEAISKAAQRGADLVQQILTFARKSDLTFSETDVNREIETLSAMLLETFPKKVSVTLDLDPKLPLVLVDRNRLHQALLNLAVNARDAMPDGGTLTFRTRNASGYRLRELYKDESSASQYVEIEVSDTGMGISEETKSRIFEPFFTTKDKGKGTGLGLAVVYGVVQSHRGLIAVESQLGAGTSFRLYFPCSDSLAPATEDVVDDSSGISGNETILVVEDEPLMLELLTDQLSERGFTVITAGDGLEGVDVFKSRASEIDLVLTDLGLPKLDGWQLIKQVLSIKPTVKVVLASGYLEPEIKSRLLDIGVTEIVQKPYVSSDILRRIRNLLDGH